MALSNPATTLSIRIPPEMRDQLDALSDATGRTKSFLAAAAIASYLATQTWQVTAIKKAVKKADGKHAKFVDHSKVVDWVDSWGDEGEKDAPE